MASSRVTSNGPDWTDIASMLKAFEEQNSIRVEISFSRWTTRSEPDISVVGKAWGLEVDRRVVKPLGFTSVTWRAGRFKTLEGLITYLLYNLDFQLAEHEWNEDPKP